MMATKKSDTPIIPAPSHGRPLTKEEWKFVKENIKKQQEYGKKEKHGKKEKTD